MKDAAADAIDCLIIGGGPAGLTAALYLARFERRFLLVDDGESRAAWIPESHNFPVFSSGVAGKQMLALQRSHLARYGVEPVAGRVVSLRRGPEDFAAEVDEGGQVRIVRSHTVLAATGAVDCEPAMPDLSAAMRQGLLRYCPICDGYEARGKAVGVIGYGARGLGEAMFLARSYAEDVTLLTLGEGMALTAEQRDRAAQYRIKLVETPIAALEMEAGRVAAIRMGDGKRHRFDTLYAALGLHVRSELARSLGAAHDEAGALTVDAHNQTSVDGLYAAGDTVSGLNQIVVAMGHAAVAATAIHNRCSLASVPRRLAP
jgi:thioredoxin reductase (NADPH)